MVIIHQNLIIQTHTHTHTQKEIQILTLKIVIKSQEKRTKEEMNDNQKKKSQNNYQKGNENTPITHLFVAVLCSLPDLSSLTRD